MNKIITDIPDTAEKIVIHVFDQEDFDLGQTTFDIRTLQNAPQKRVIELPSDVIAKLQKEEVASDNVQELTTTIDWSVIKTIAHTISEKNDDAINLIADWYLHPGLVEFAPEPDLFVVKGRLNGEEVAFRGTGNSVQYDLSKTPSLYNSGWVMSEEKANALIAGLGGEDGFLKVRKVKVEE